MQNNPPLKNNTAVQKVKLVLPSSTHSLCNIYAMFCFPWFLVVRPLAYVLLLYFKLQWPVVGKGHSCVFFSLMVCSFSHPLSHCSSCIWVIIIFGLMGIICNLMCKPPAVSHSNAKASIAPISWWLQRNLSQTSYNPVTYCLAGLTLSLLHWFCQCCLKGILWPFAFLNRSVCVCLGEQ